MKKTKKLLSLAMALLMLLSVGTVTAFAIENDLTFSLRIEGVDKTFFDSSVTFKGIPQDYNVSLSYALELVDQSTDDLTITGADDGYITEVNGDKAGRFGGWDGWLYTVNGVSPDVGVGDYTLSNNDTIVLYYGDYPCQLPVIDTTMFAASGVIKFTSNDTVYDKDWNPTTVQSPVTNMTVTLNNDLVYTTDENGEIKVDLTKIKFISPLISLQISKVNPNGAPAVCRYPANFTISSPVRECNLYGDVDLDGNVNIKDATYIQMYLARMQEITPEQFIAGDVNTDYEVTINDATIIQLYLAKSYDSLPIK